MSVKKKHFYSEAEVAQMGIKSRAALRNDRWTGKGLPYVKVGKSVRYYHFDVEKYLKDRKVTPSEL